MTIRLYDLEKLTNEVWSTPHEWRYHDKNIEFGLETSNGMQWFSYAISPSRIVDIVCSYKKMLPKIELRQNEN